MQKLIIELSACAALLGCAVVAYAVPPGPELSEADEVHIGELMAQQVIALNGTLPSPQMQKIEKYLQSVTDKVGAQAERKLPYRIHYDPDPSFKSAFGLPGGQIFIGAGILAFMDSEDQLAAVIGHEIEHVSLNQCRDRLLQIMAEQHISAKDADKLKVDPFFPGYGKAKELAADENGMIIAAKAGYSPVGMVRMLQTFLLMEQQMPNTQSEARANLQNRVNVMQQLIAREHLATPKERPVAWP